MESSFFWDKSRSLPLFLQGEIAECGLACVAMIAAYYGHDINLIGLRRRFPQTQRGSSFKHLVDIATQLHFNTRPLKFEIEHLRDLHMPCILHWDMDHFVVLKAVTRRGIVLHDPAFGVRTMGFDEFSRHFTGVALEIKPAQEFRPLHAKPRMSFSQLFGQSIGFKSSLAQVFLLSIILMALTMSLPIFMQLIFDEVLGGLDRQLLPLLVMGLIAVTFFRTLSGFLRGLFLLFIGKALSFHAGASIFHRLVRLPLVYFERRHIGDLMSRFASLEHIKRFLTEGMAEVLVDGCMSLLMLGLMLIYSPHLSSLSILAVGIYALLRLAFFQPFRRLSEEAIISQAREQSNFLETIRGIQSIKLYGGESDRHSLWQNLYGKVLNANTGLGRFRIGFQSLQDLAFGLTRVGILYWGVVLVFENRLSAGMLIAFLAYQDQFVEKIKTFIENMMQLKMLDLHMDRMADIVLENPDYSGDAEDTDLTMVGQMELKNLSFRYDEHSPYLFKDLNLRIAAGESVAIVGPSGCGKTTLIKIMVGLFVQDEGRILIDGHDLMKCRKQFQNRIATVMQDDHLLSGSIVDNIAFFDSQPDMERVLQSARRACIYDEIMQLPMRFNTLIGDMGSTLSGGQKQRVLLARALYRQPSFLFLDEATSHLDHKVESIVNTAIRELKITRIMIAHRMETILSADRIILLNEGGLKETTPDEYRSRL